MPADKDIASQVRRALTPLMGLKLSWASYAGDMRQFGFGPTRRRGQGISPEYALHLLCAWRITRNSHLICALADWYRPENEEDLVKIADDSWDPIRDGNLQEASLIRLFGTTRTKRFLVNETSALVVTDVDADEIGGFNLRLTPNYALSVFPTCTRGEHWRLFKTDHEESPHFVVESEGLGGVTVSGV